MKTKKKPQPQRRCIFCDGTPVTGEHLFSAWISKIVPRTGQRNVAFRSSNPVGAPRQVNEIRRTEGDLLSKKIRAPCKKCNETWMSVLETQARPILTPLILGQQYTLMPQGQQILGRWAILKTIITEKDHQSSAVIPNASIEHFYKTGELPPNHNVWIGHYKGQIWKGTHYYHRAISASRYVDPESNNFQTTTLVVGELYIHVFSAPPLVTYEIHDPARFFLAAVLPLQGAHVIHWPLALSLDDSMAMRIAYGR